MVSNKNKGLVWDVWPIQYPRFGTAARNAKTKVANAAAIDTYRRCYLKGSRSLFPHGVEREKTKKGTRLDALFAQPPYGYSFGRLLSTEPP